MDQLIKQLKSLSKKNSNIILAGAIDEKFKPHQYTITGFLNSNLKENNSPIKSKDPIQYTIGMVSGFENWLFKIKKLRPEYILIYTSLGCSDAHMGFDDEKYLYDGFLLNPDKFEAFKDNIKSRSFISRSIRNAWNDCLSWNS